MVRGPNSGAAGGKGGRKAPRSTIFTPDVPVSIRVANRDPFTGSENYKEDTRGRAYPAISIPDEAYLTTYEVGLILRMYPESVFRWCRNWFGKLPPGRIGGKRMGYRIPLEYLYVARAWKQVEHPKLREQIRWALVDDLKDYVVLCGAVVSTHYTTGDVVERLQQLYNNPMLSQQVTTVVYVGPIKLTPDGSLAHPDIPKPLTRGVSKGVRVVPTFTK